MILRSKGSTRRVVYMFPGQGAQRIGMGKDMFHRFPDLTAKADEILGYSIKELCLEDKQGRLGQTQFTQPAVYVVNALSYLHKIENHAAPDYLLGHSVGEYNALLAAGVMDFETGLKIVKKRGQLMGAATGGAMAAVMGLDEIQVEDIIREKKLEGLHIANLNSPHQMVLSGLKKDVKEAEELFLANGATHFKMLNVSGAFHTPYMTEARDQFEELLKRFQFSEPTIPVISNVTARPYLGGDIKRSIVLQMTAPVRWTESVVWLLKRGMDIDDFEEVGVRGISVVKSLAMRTYAAFSSEPGSGAIHKKEASGVTASSLGSPRFKADYQLQYAYVADGLHYGLSGIDMVVRLACAGMLGFFGSTGLNLNQLEQAVQDVQRQLRHEPYGFSISPESGEFEENAMDLFLQNGVPALQCSRYMRITPALVRFRAKAVSCRIIANVADIHTARLFLEPAPQNIVGELKESGQISGEEAERLAAIPVANTVCVTSGGVDLAVAVMRLKDEIMARFNYAEAVYAGCGAVGTPETAAAAFMLGADFIQAGSINLCTPQSGACDIVKDMLQDMQVQDTETVPASHLFTLGAKVRVLKKGVFFPARANKLYDLYQRYDSLHQLQEMDGETAALLQQSYFKRSFEEVFQEIETHYLQSEIRKAAEDEKYKMSLVFRWYLDTGLRLALAGDETRRVDFQVQCDDSMGAFNGWVKNTELENRRERHVDRIAKEIMNHAAALMPMR